MPILAHSTLDSPPWRRHHPAAGDIGRLLCAVGSVLWLFIASSPAAAVQATTEYDLKAAFLFNFAQFVEWPADAFPEATTPLIIGVLGDDPFGASIETLVTGETIRQRPLLVRRYRTVEQIDVCHILFVSSSETSQLSHIGKVLAHRSILTVGETKDFAARAGIVEFGLTRHHLRLLINRAAARDARLVISSKLLRQAQIVQSSGDRQ